MGQAGLAHSTILPFPTERKRPYKTARCPEVPPSNVVRLYEPVERVRIRAEVKALVALAGALGRHERKPEVSIASAFSTRLAMMAAEDADDDAFGALAGHLIALVKIHSQPEAL